MVKYLFSLFFVVLSFVSVSQDIPSVECTTIAKSSWVNKLQSLKTNTNFNRKSSQLAYVPIQIHLITLSNGLAGLSLQQIRSEIDSVNAFYANANMFFYECSPPEIIQDDSLYNYEYATEEPILLDQHYTSDIVNLYFPNSARVNGTLVCGYSQFPPSVDYAVIAASCATNGSTLAHELGHYFGLFHTHGDFSQGELVDGSNCSFDGDFICDTPADPILSSTNVNSSCVYVDTAVDANFMTYTPDVTNIMSYSRKVCRNKFSAEQYLVAEATLHSERSNLFCQNALSVNTSQKKEFSLFPNPGTSTINITLSDNTTTAQFQLFNTLGSVVYSSSFSGDSFRANTSELPTGIYFYTIKSEEFSQTGKWIKIE